MKFSGKCLCGAVNYQAVGAPVVVAQCHCDECRRLSGTGHTIGAMFKSSEVTLNGNLQEYTYTSCTGSEVTKAFCATCGSPIYGANTRLADHVTLSVGTMDDASALRVQVVIFERDKQQWDQLADDVVSFDTQPEWSPES